MNSRIRRTCSPIAVGALLAITALFGLSSSDAAAQTTAAAVQLPRINLDTPRIRLEPAPEDSPLRSTLHIYNGLGQEIETQIFYKNGNFETLSLRPDGSKLSSHLENRNGADIGDLTYAADGATVIGGYLKRPDGTLLMQVTSQAGVITTKSYWWDGSSVFLTQVVQPDGSYVSEYRHKNGKLWMRRLGSNATNVNSLTREEVYNANTGLLESVREPRSDSLTVSSMRPDGTLQLKQIFSITQSSWGDPTPTLTAVEEYSADGKTMVRKTIMQTQTSDDGSYDSGSQTSPTSIEIHNADGTTTVHTVRNDLSVSREQILDSKGAVVSTKDFNPGDPDAPHETFDQGLTSVPSGSEDPSKTWQNSEDNTSWRSPDL